MLSSTPRVPVKIVQRLTMTKEHINRKTELPQTLKSLHAFMSEIKINSRGKVVSSKRLYYLFCFYSPCSVFIFLKNPVA